MTGEPQRRGGKRHTASKLTWALLAVGLCPLAVDAAVLSWINPGVNEPWENPANWAPAFVPGVGDIAMVGNLPIAHDTNVVIEDDRIVTGLDISNGASLYINEPGSLNVIGQIFIDGPGSELSVQRLPGTGLSANRITLTDSAEFRVLNGATVNIGDFLFIADTSEVEARGVFNFTADFGQSLLNNGRIESRAGFGGLVFNQLGDAPIDLDGVAGDGVVVVDKGKSMFFGQDQFTINGTELNDDFSGTIELATASLLTMNLTNGWTADADSVINIKSTTTNSQGDARIQGGHFTMAGLMNLYNETTGNDDIVHIEATSTIAPTAVFQLDADNHLHFDAATTVNGGTFNTASLLGVDGAVRFNEATTWNGTVVVSGIAQQFGDAEVTGITNITAGVLDMDGGGNTQWDINHFLTIQAQRIDSTLSNTFDGTLLLDNPFSRLTLNLTGAFDKWTMAGEMNLAGGFGEIGAIRVAGSTMRVTGQLNASDRTRIAANTEFATGGVFTFADADTQLTMEAESTIEAGATFVGQGTLRNHTSGHMRLADGASLDNIRLQNHGLFEVGNSPGAAAVPEFDQRAEGTWLVEIGGHIAGTEHDLLLTGETFLDGLIEVDLIDTGSGQFLPTIGDEFTVLTSLGDINGTFLNDPISMAAGMAYHWQVVYEPHNIKLQLTSINPAVPEPSTVLLALAGVAAILVSRRR